ncbi:hypothetical protein Ae201684P_012533 [Aphanomyces euteiches]|nr:hypothetical protein Ae201684P_012533 [Aphanomyces euteiches]
MWTCAVVAGPVNVSVERTVPLWILQGSEFDAPSHPRGYLTLSSKPSQRIADPANHAPPRHDSAPSATQFTTLSAYVRVSLLENR